MNINIIIWKKGSKPEHILFLVRDTVAVFKKETQLLIESGDIDISNINIIDIVIGGDHGQGAFRFPMKILYIMNNGTRYRLYIMQERQWYNIERYNNQKSW